MVEYRWVRPPCKYAPDQQRSAKVNIMKQILAIALLLLLFPLQTSAADVKTIDRDGLKSLLNSPDLVVVDVRTASDWSSSEFKIKGAVRVEPGEVLSWAGGRAKDKIYVLYCA
jgi:hypothetical protein